MTKYEILERKLNSIQAEIRQAKKDGTGEKQYADPSYFSDNCNDLLYHREGHEPWNSFVRLAKSLYGVNNVSSLRLEHAEVCKNYINDLISIHNKYEKLIGAYVINQYGYCKKLPYSAIAKMLDKENEE